MGDTAPQTFGEIIDGLATREPSQRAVIDDRNAVTYADLASESERIARSLLTLGVRHGDTVAALLENRWEWVSLWLGAARIGAKFAPMNTWYQPRELEWNLRHVEAKVLIAQTKFLKRDYGADIDKIVPSLSRSAPGEHHDPQWPILTSVVFIDASRPGAFGWDEFLELGRDRSREELVAAQEAVKGSDPLYVLYTSGSTADPKGVVLRHGDAIANCTQIGMRRGISKDDRAWLGGPLFYGLGAIGTLPVVMLQAATLVVQSVFDPEQALATIERHECTAFFGVSSIVRRIYESPGFDRKRVESLERGTATISPEERRILIEEMGATRVTQSFGLTEVYGQCCVGEPDDPLEVKLTTCGRPLPGMEIKVVDPKSREEVDPGSPGLLLVRGHTTKEYFRNPEETAAAIDEDGFFVTGDLGYIDEEGRMRYVSRLKEMIKTNGINVSPFEIEQLLLRHDEITEACVVGVPDERRGEAIVAFVVGTVTADGVRSYMRETAANFKVPTHVFIDQAGELPRLATGKIARLELKSSALERLEA